MYRYAHSLSIWPVPSRACSFVDGLKFFAGLLEWKLEDDDLVFKGLNNLASNVVRRTPHRPQEQELLIHWVCDFDSELEPYMRRAEEVTLTNFELVDATFLAFFFGIGMFGE